MYRPPAFREDRPEVLTALIRAHPLATLVTTGAAGLTANLIPFTLVEGPDPEGKGGDILRCHLAKANGQLDDLRAGAEALVIFQGPEAYITPSWYALKAETGKVVPTWNYVVVQAWGTPHVTDDADWLMAQITALTQGREEARAEPWAVTDAPADFLAGQLKGITGVEIPIARIEGKWKVSQNRSQADRRGVIEGLRTDGDTTMAAIVEERGN
jgi:transcriptional regulator